MVLVWNDGFFGGMFKKVCIIYMVAVQLVSF